MILLRHYKGPEPCRSYTLLKAVPFTLIPKYSKDTILLLRSILLHQLQPCLTNPNAPSALPRPPSSGSPATAVSSPKSSAAKQDHYADAVWQMARLVHTVPPRGQAREIATRLGSTSPSIPPRRRTTATNPSKAPRALLFHHQHHISLASCTLFSTMRTDLSSTPIRDHWVAPHHLCFKSIPASQPP